jgi:hypothetical protein
MEPTFNGLGMHLGNPSQLSNAITRSVGAGELQRRQGRGGMATAPEPSQRAS